MMVVLERMGVMNARKSVDGERCMARTKHSVVFAGKSSPITLGFLAAIGLVVGGSQSALAQVAPVTQPQSIAPQSIAPPQQIFQDQQNRDPFSSRGGDQAGGVMDLVHRAMQAGSISNEDFVTEQQENLDSATAAFRAAQQKRLTGTPTAPIATPSIVTPSN